MRNGSQRLWIVLALIAGAGGYYLAGEKGGDGLLQARQPVEDEAPIKVRQTPTVESPIQPIQAINQEPAVEIVHQEEAQAALPHEENPLDDNAFLPTVAQEDAFLDADDDSSIFIEDVNAVPVNHGEELDPDMEDYLQTSSTGNKYVEEVGEFMDPDWDFSLESSEETTTPQHIGPHIDPDYEEATIIVQDRMEEVINIGEYLDHDLQQ